MHPTDAYAEGRRAFQEGRWLDANPWSREEYRPWRRWRDGWHDADAEDSGPILGPEAAAPDLAGVICPGWPTCLQAEAARLAGRRERKLGWRARPLWAFDVQNLCVACRARWHADQATQAARDLRQLRAQRPAALGA